MASATATSPAPAGARPVQHLIAQRVLGDPADRRRRTTESRPVERLAVRSQQQGGTLVHRRDGGHPVDGRHGVNHPIGHGRALADLPLEVADRADDDVRVRPAGGEQVVEGGPPCR